MCTNCFDSDSRARALCDINDLEDFLGEQDYRSGSGSTKGHRGGYNKWKNRSCHLLSLEICPGLGRFLPVSVHSLKHASNILPHAQAAATTHTSACLTFAFEASLDLTH